MGNTLNYTNTGLLLVSADEVKELINKYAKTNDEAHLLTYKVGCLTGVIATEEQMLSLLGNKEIDFND